MARKHVDHQPGPPWPETHDRPRVLIESSDGAMRWAEETLLERAGYEVRTCEGPSQFKDGRCPLVTTGECGLAWDADVVYNQLSLHPECNREIVVAMKDYLPDIPLVVETVPHEAEREAELLDGIAVEAGGPTAQRILNGVKRALGRRRKQGASSDRA